MTAARPLASDELSPMTVDELAALLDVDRRLVYAMAARGQIPGVLRLGRLLRFARPAVIAWLSEGHGASQSKRRR